jgi:hypothetical protein
MLLVHFTRPFITEQIHTEVELAVVNTAETYVFVYPLFSGNWAKYDQLRVLGKFREQLKRAAIQ